MQNIQNKTTLVQSPFMTLGQEMTWANYTTLPRPCEAVSKAGHRTDRRWHAFRRNLNIQRDKGKHQNMKLHAAVCWNSESGQVSSLSDSDHQLPGHRIISTNKHKSLSKPHSWLLVLGNFKRAYQLAINGYHQVVTIISPSVIWYVTAIKCEPEYSPQTTV